MVRLQWEDELEVLERQKLELSRAVAALKQQIKELSPRVAGKRQEVQAELDRVAAEMAAVRLRERKLDTWAEGSEAASSPRSPAPDTPQHVRCSRTCCNTDCRRARRWSGATAAQTFVIIKTTQC